MLRFLSSEQFWEQYSKNFTILIIRTIFILIEQFNGFLSFKRLTTKSILVKIIFHIYVDLKYSVQNSSWKTVPTSIVQNCVIFSVITTSSTKRWGKGLTLCSPFFCLYIQIFQISYFLKKALKRLFEISEGRLLWGGISLTFPSTKGNFLGLNLS